MVPSTVRGAGAVVSVGSVWSAAGAGAVVGADATATGETVTLYGGSVTRSIGYVAWQNRDTYKQGTASYKYVWNIINSVDTSKYPN